MHKIKQGEFKYLVVVIHERAEDGSDYLFYDDDHQASVWMLGKMRQVDNRSPVIFTLPDLNHLLNNMVKRQKDPTGQVLYDIFIENYPDGDHKDKVIDFWKKKL